MSTSRSWGGLVVVACAAALCVSGWLVEAQQDAGSTRRRSVQQPRDPRPTGELTVPDPGQTPFDARISPGRIPLLTMLEYLQQSTGQIVVYPSAFHDPVFGADVEIHVLGDIDPVTPAIVRSILESNGYRFYQEKLTGGVRLLHVRHLASRTMAPPPNITEILGPGTPVPEGDEDTLATMVVMIEHISTQSALVTLRELLGLAGNTASELQVVLVPNSSSIVLKGRKTDLAFAHRILGLLDRPAPRAAEAPQTPKD